MEATVIVLLAGVVLAWLGIWGLFGSMRRVRESLDSDEDCPSSLDSESDITVLIPARNEAECIAKTLTGLAHQSRQLKVIVIDDESEDATADIARRSDLTYLQVISGRPLAPGWTGKLWALQQGLDLVTTPYVLLLDADIELRPGVLAALDAKLRGETIDFASIMARLRMQSFWERCLMPAFVFFFRLLYPFSLSNHRKQKRFAAAAGGCILTKTAILREINAFASIRGAVIDDCALAMRVKQHGYTTWIGLSRAVISHRSYSTLRSIWDMVARTAYTQLHYSSVLLLLATVLLLVFYALPIIAVPVAIKLGSLPMLVLALLAFALMVLLYRPLLRYYDLSGGWALLMPVIASLFLAMTWSSAWQYWQGRRAVWKNRTYLRSSS